MPSSRAYFNWHAKQSFICTRLIINSLDVYRSRWIQLRHQHLHRISNVQQNEWMNVSRATIHTFIFLEYFTAFGGVKYYFIISYRSSRNQQMFIIIFNNKIMHIFYKLISLSFCCCCCWNVWCYENEWLYYILNKHSICRKRKNIAKTIWL